MTAPDRRGSALDRFLRLFTDVRAGEGATALLLAANVFVLLMAYYILKVLREPLIRGADIRSYASAGQAILLVFLVPLYGLIAKRVPRRRLINLVTAFFAACLVVFFVLYGLGVEIGVPFFIWQGAFNMMIMAQFWSFANDLYTTDEGKRLFPMVAVGGSVGAVVGSSAAGVLMNLLGLQPLFLVIAFLLLVAAAITGVVDVRERKRTEAVVPDFMSSGQIPAATPQIRAPTGEFKVPGEAYITASGTQRTLTREDLERARTTPIASPPPPRTRGAFGMVFSNRYLLLIALLLLILNFVNSTGEYILNRMVRAIAATEATSTGADKDLIIGTYYSGYQTTVNLLSLTLQLLVVSRVIKYLGVARALFILPVIAFGAYAVMAFLPLLGAIRWAKITENSTDYSLQNTVRQALFLPTTREEKYAAKQAIDGFFVRMGDVLHALLVVYVGANLLHLGLRQFAVLNMVLVVVWLILAVFIGRRYERLVAATA